MGGSMGRSSYKIYNKTHPYFLTCTLVGWVPIFSSPLFAQIILDSLKFLIEQKRIRLYAYVVMDTHMHWVADAKDLVKEAGDFKSYTARQIIDLADLIGRNDLLKLFHVLKCRHKKDRLYQVWQEGSHPEEIFSRSMMWQKINYIHNNPVKKRYVTDPIDWKYSSAVNYAGLEGLLTVVTDWD
jgi:putative transposase